MKRQSLFLLLFYFVSSFAFAQKETYEDIIPYRKGNMWGLVYHRGATFYPAVLEGVVTNEYEGTIYFSDPETEKPCFLVKKGGKKYKLTTDKKLKPLAKNEVDREFFAPRVVMPDDEVPPETEQTIAEPVNKTEPRLVKKMQPYPNDTALIRIYRQNNSLRFFYKGQWISKLECNNIIDDIRNRSDKWDLILQKDDKLGVADLQPPAMVLPFAYDGVQYLFPGDFFILSTADKVGVFNLSNKKWAIEQEQRAIWFLGKDGNGYYYFNVTGPDKTARLIRLDYLTDKPSVLADSINGMLHPMLHTYTEDRGRYTCFVIRKNNKWGLVDENGRMELPANYDEIKLTWAGIGADESVRLLLLQQGKQTGWMDLFTHTVVAPRYTLEGIVYPLAKEVKNQRVLVFKVNRNGTSFYVDNYGKEFYSR